MNEMAFSAFYVKLVRSLYSPPPLSSKIFSRGKVLVLRVVRQLPLVSTQPQQLVGKLVDMDAYLFRIFIESYLRSLDSTDGSSMIFLKQSNSR